MDAFRQLRMGYETAKSLGYLAIAHGQQGKVLRALDLFTEARGMFVREQNTVWPALLDLYQAVILLGAGRLFEARRSCRAALAFFVSSALASKAILCRLLLARHPLLYLLDTHRIHANAPMMLVPATSSMRQP